MLPEPLSPDAFAAVVREIVANSSKHEAHRRLDRVTTELLTALGYGHGAAIFSEAVHGWHHPQVRRYPLPERPRWLCRIGSHRWQFDRESEAPWCDPEICTECGSKRSFNPCP